MTYRSVGRERAPIPLRRADEQRPLLDLDAIERRLQASDGRTTRAVDAIRAIQLVGFLLYESTGVLERPGSADPTTIPVSTDAAALRRVSGLMVAEITRAVEALRALAILTPLDPSDATHARFTGEALAPHPGASQIAWRTVIHRLKGRPAALLVVRVLADLLTAPRQDPAEVAHAGEWRSVSKPELASRTHYTGGMVRDGLAVAIAQGVLQRATLEGYPHKFRFVEDVLREPAPIGAATTIEGWAITGGRMVAAGPATEGAASTAPDSMGRTIRGDRPDAPMPSHGGAPGSPGVASGAAPSAVSGDVAVRFVLPEAAGAGFIVEMDGVAIPFPPGASFPLLPVGAETRVSGRDAVGRPIFVVRLPS